MLSTDNMPELLVHAPKPTHPEEIEHAFKDGNLAPLILIFFTN